MRKTSAFFIIFLAVFIVLSSLIIGDKGFWGDDWPSLSFSFWYPLAEAMNGYAILLRRPITSLYVVPIFKITNYDPMLILIASELLLLVGHLLMAVALFRVFPRQRFLIFTTVIISFFMPMLLTSGYGTHSDNTRLTVIFYWLSVLGFQYWGEHLRRWNLPFFPILFFAFALMSYEAVAAMPVLTALLVLPIYWQKYHSKSWGHHIWAAGQLVTAHVLSYVIFFYVRTAYQIQSHVSATDSSAGMVQLLVDYVRYIGLWLWHGVRYAVLHGDVVSWILGALVAAVIALLYSTQRTTFTHQDNVPIRYVLLLSVVWFIVGILPFVVFNQEPHLLMTIGGKGYIISGSAIGFFIAYGVQRIWQRQPILATVFVAVWVGIFSSYHVALRLQYQEANREREALFQSLADEVPNLADNTVLLFVNNPYSIQVDTLGVSVVGEGQTDYWVKMFYHNRTLTAAALVDYETGFNPVVSDAGLYVPGATVPLDAVVMVERVGNQYQLIDTITDESPYVITWEDGIDTLETNQERILSAPDEPTRFQKIFVYDD